MDKKALKEFLDKKVDQYNQPSFIKDDPVWIPHLFTKKADIEIEPKQIDSSNNEQLQNDYNFVLISKA